MLLPFVASAPRAAGSSRTVAILPRVRLFSPPESRLSLRPDRARRPRDRAASAGPVAPAKLAASTLALLSACGGGVAPEVCEDVSRLVPGQVAVDREHPAWLTRHEHGPLFVCGAGDPEDFLYRGERRPDGTRDGDQEAIIAKLAESGANSIYIQAIRSHGGDGEPDHNPFVDSDERMGLDENILAQWGDWFAELDEHGVVIFLFLYDDGANPFPTSDHVSPTEHAFVTDLVKRFQHVRNLVWIVGEEYIEAYSPPRIAEIARRIRHADDHDHPIGNHVNPNRLFREFADDPWLDVFMMQWHATSADEVHQITARQFVEADGRYNLNMSEVMLWGTGREARTKHWAAALGGAYVMVLGWDVVSTPMEDLEDCGRVVEFMEGTRFVEGRPRPDLAYGSTRYLLGAPGEFYIAYTDRGGEFLGVRDAPAGTYDLTWFDPATGERTQSLGVALPGGDTTFPAPAGTIGAESVIYVERVD